MQAVPKKRKRGARTSNIRMSKRRKSKEEQVHCLCAAGNIETVAHECPRSGSDPASRVQPVADGSQDMCP